MAAVSYEDDTVRRWVVRRYVFDPARRERRHVVVAVFDNFPEFEATFSQLCDELDQRRAKGQPVDPREHVSGVELEPGYLARAANGHRLRRALKRGVWPEGMATESWPTTMHLLRFEETVE